MAAMPISTEAIKDARDLIKSGGVFHFGGRTAHDEDGLQVIISAEGEADSDAPLFSLDLAEIKRRAGDLTIAQSDLQVARRSVEIEKAELEKERSELEAEKVRLADDRKAFEAEKEAWLDSRGNESVIPLKVIYEAESLEDMSHEDLGRLCGIWEIQPVPAKKVERIAAVLEAQRRHEEEEAKRNLWHDGDPNEGS
jgi:hypothetical protein